MKILVTILQCRRVVLPHLFIKYAVPMMQKIPGVEVSVHIIQHSAPKDLSSRMATSSYPIEKENLVREWTKEGKYQGALITTHEESCTADPSLPSWQKGYEYALQTDADFYMWLEDDAFVYDRNCGLWPDVLKGALVGFYRDEPDGYIRNAHYVCNKEFVKYFLPFLQDTSLWNIKISIFSDEEKRILNLDAPRMEPRITKLAGTRKIKLDSKCAARYSKKQENQARLKELLTNICPDELHLLSIDFPDLI